jgi:hypothetical protein
MRLWVLAVVGCVGCASGNAKPSAVPRRAPVVAEPTEAERRPYAELVPAPAVAAASPGIWLQVANPSLLVGKLPDAVQSKPVLRVLKDVMALTSGALGPDVAAIVDLSQPVDLVMPIDGLGLSPPLAFALRVRSPEVIERGEAGLTLRRVGAGFWRLGNELSAPSDLEQQEGEEEEEPEDEEGEMAEAEPAPSRLPCLLAHAAPPVGYRVLCGGQLDFVQASAPFLLGERPKVSADVHVELGGPAYRAVLDKALAQVKAEGKTELQTLSGSEKFGEQAGLAIVEALGAHDQISLDVRLGTAGAELQLDVAFPESAASAGLQQWAAARANSRLPASFGRLPGDSGMAFSFSGLGKDTTRSALELVLGQITSDMAQEFVLSEKEVRQLTEAFIGIVPADAHFSVAAGADANAVESVLMGEPVRQADALQRALSPAAVKELQAAVGGWIAIGLDVPPNEYLPAVERMLRADAIPMRRRPGMPRKDSEREDSHTKRAALTTRGLPKGTLHLVNSVRPAKTFRPPIDGSEPPILPYDAHWLIVPDGQRVWIVITRNEALAGARALSLLGGGPRLAERADLQQAIARPLLLAMSYSLAGARLQGLDWDSVGQRELARVQFRRNGKVMHGANTPMLLTVEVLPQPTSSHVFALRAQLRVNQAAMSELADASGSPEE